MDLDFVGQNELGACARPELATAGKRPPCDSMVDRDGLVEMHLGVYSFILQDYYVEQLANNSWFTCVSRM
jgi:hypothetical protein